MTIRSMTGYGLSVHVVNGVKFSVEVRAVNHRFAEFQIRIPREWLSQEDDVRRALGELIQRGRVDVFIHVDGASAGTQVDVNWSLVDALIEAERELVGRFGIPLDVHTVRDWLKFPDVVQIQPTAVDVEAHAPALLQTVRDAAEQLTAMRGREGVRLAENFNVKLSQLRGLLDVVRLRDQASMSLQTEALTQRLNALSLEVDKERLAQEVVLLVDRSAVDEEVVRLASHIDSFLEALGGTGPVGRRLDFIVQEMHREVNTIGSKSTDMSIASAVVDMKVLIEQLREQVQNVE